MSKDKKKKLHEKEKFIEETITKLKKMMDSGLCMANTKLVVGNMEQVGLTIQKEYKKISTMTETKELVQEFPKKAGTRMRKYCDWP